MPEKSSPKILAKFELEEDGTPSFSKKDKLKHYAIQLFLENAPEDTSMVTYKLDPSYFEPVRKVPNVVPDFNEDITSFGDYEVSATVDAGSERIKLRTDLSKALRRYYERTKASPQIERAIEEISEY